MIKLRLLKILSLIAFTMATFHGASAQSTVFNIPSTDVQTAHRWYVEADFMAHFSSFESGGYRLYGSRLVYGMSKRAEIGVNAFFVETAPAEPVEIQPNFKFRLYENEEKGLAAAAGALVFVPLTQGAGNHTRALAYSVVSKNMKGSHGPRFTAGAYALIGPFEEGASRRGLMLGYEQPITKKLTFVTDWSSGNNDFGYVVAGAGIVLSRKSVLYVGYNVGNQGRANNSFGVFYGYSF